MENKLKISVNAIIESFNVYTKEITKTSKIHNLIVDTGLDEVIDNGLVNIGHMAIGTDNTAVVAGDLILGVETKRQAVSNTNEGIGIREYDETFLFSSGESFTIVEAGLFDSAIISGSTMLNRLVFTGHDVDVDNGVRVKITITLSAV